LLTNYFGAPILSGGGDPLANFKWITLGVCTVVALVILNPWLISWVQEKGFNKYIIYAGQVVVLLILFAFLCR
jgi:hypothetical protein